MIPRDYITEWRTQVPWVQDIQVEQDLVICRALVAVFADPLLATALAFRGGTALYKLHVTPAARYSEDIDLVQMRAEPAGAVMDALHSVLDPWLGTPRRKQSEGRVTFMYRFTSEGVPPLTMRLKVEINSREHFAVHGFKQMPFSVSSRWFAGTCDVSTYALDELLATKLRALYQRSKGRDLFDLALALGRGGVDPERIVRAFLAYMGRGGHGVTRAEFERNMARKLADPRFTADIGPLLAQGYEWDAAAAAKVVLNELIARLPGDPWKSPSAPQSRPT